MIANPKNRVVGLFPVASHTLNSRKFKVSVKIATSNSNTLHTFLSIASIKNSRPAMYCCFHTLFGISFFIRLPLI